MIGGNFSAVDIRGLAVMALGLVMLYLLPRFVREGLRLAMRVAGLLTLALGALVALGII